QRRAPQSSTHFPYTTLFRSDNFALRESCTPKIATILARSKPSPQGSITNFGPMYQDADAVDFSGNPGGEQEARDQQRHGQCQVRSEEHTSELQSRENLVCRL